jgi:purine operon repressor
LLEEFEAQVAGIAVLVEAEKIEERLVDEYLSLVQLTDVNVKEKTINVKEGNYFDNNKQEV